MKSLQRIFLLAIVCTAVLAMARMIGTEFTGTETLAGPPSGGTIKCPQGQPTGSFPYGPPCTDGPVVARGLVFQYLETSTDRRMNGPATVVANANWNGWTPYGPGSGPMWGTLELNGDEGVWEGVWAGTRTVTDKGAYSRMHVIAFGTSGDIRGLKAEWDLTYTPASPAGSFSGYIIAHDHDRNHR